MTTAEDDKSPSDIDLFKKAVSDVQPLKQEKRPDYRKPRRPVPISWQSQDTDHPTDTLADLQIDTPEFLEFVRPGIQIRLFHEMQRGKLTPEATLDLHGLRVAEAKPAFLHFLNQCTRSGLRCVRIIHGKGRGSGSGQPVLKQKANQWLQQRKEVLAFCTAPRWDGGSGAAYVLLSRKFQDRD